MSRIHVNLEAVIVTVSGDTPRVLVIRSDPDEVVRLPSGRLGPDDRTLHLALRRWVREQSGLELGYVEQLYTFGDVDRNPARSGRSLSIAYLALIHDGAPSRGAEWMNIYSLIPWEDHRVPDGSVIPEWLSAELIAWSTETRDADEQALREERVHVTFGLGQAAWDGVRVLERYELLYEVGLLEESPTHFRGRVVPSTAMALDHRRIVATALSRLRGKLTYRPVVFELLTPAFTLLELQTIVEALSGVTLHKQNFRRLVERGGLVEGTGRTTRTGGRPAELFRFRREVLRERPRPGVGTPWSSQ